MRDCVYVHALVCICLCVFVFMCLLVCIYVRAFIGKYSMSRAIDSFELVCVCVYVTVTVYMRHFVFMSLLVFVYTCVYFGVCLCALVYMYVCVCYLVVTEKNTACVRHFLLIWGLMTNNFFPLFIIIKFISRQKSNRIKK